MSQWIHIYIQQILYIQSSNTSTPKQKKKTKAKNRSQKQIIVGCIEASQWIYTFKEQILYIQSSNPAPPQRKNNKRQKQDKNKKKKKKGIKERKKNPQTINSLVCRSFSINIYLYATNTLYPILLPPPPQKKNKTSTKNKEQIIDGCILISQWIYTYVKQILYVQASTPHPP